MFAQRQARTITIVGQLRSARARVCMCVLARARVCVSVYSVCLRDMCMYMGICTRACMCLCMCVYTSVRACACLRRCMQTAHCISLNVPTRMCVRARARARVCVCVCVCLTQSTRRKKEAVHILCRRYCERRLSHHTSLSKHKLQQPSAINLTSRYTGETSSPYSSLAPSFR